MIKRVTGAPGGQSGEVEVGEIQSVSTELTTFKVLPMLEPAEVAASMPNPDDTVDRKMAMLNRALGERLTVNSPVWSGDPIPRMRALQKRLIAYSLTMEEDDRQSCMDAIRVVEYNVQMRLRWQQMERSDLELDEEEPPAEGPDQDEEAEQAQQTAQLEGEPAARAIPGRKAFLALPNPRRNKAAGKEHDA